jgi:hypothetical protein
MRLPMMGAAGLSTKLDSRSTVGGAATIFDSSERAYRSLPDLLMYAQI